MDDLTQKLAVVTDFAHEHAMPVVPAVLQQSIGPDACLDDLDVEDFLDLAHQLKAPALYLFVPRPESADPPRERHNQPYHVTIAFVAGGVFHHWQYTASWYLEWQTLVDSQRPSVVSIVDSLLEMTGFRATKPRDRRRFAQAHLPAGIDEYVGRDAVDQALRRIEEISQVHYDDLNGHYDDFAARLLDDPAYQRAASPAARKTATEQFLTACTGFFPPTAARDELYAQARNLTKTGQRSRRQS
ncbi:hypothetical protein [Krasilnikovia sp. MM14-A1259]|uniref:hypothetical protein n=1 Tax=Krasilnikovia sp. MM14-A1259 TaxID=3373539 RepID=UPI00380C15FE